MYTYVFHNELTCSMESGVNPIGTGGVIPQIPILLRHNPKFHIKKTNRSLSYSKNSPGYKFSSFQLILDKQTSNIVFLIYNEPFGLGRSATDYSTASRSRFFNCKQQQ